MSQYRSYITVTAKALRKSAACQLERASQTHGKHKHSVLTQHPDTPASQPQRRKPGLPAYCTDNSTVWSDTGTHNITRKVSPLCQEALNQRGTHSVLSVAAGGLTDTSTQLLLPLLSLLLALLLLLIKALEVCCQRALVIIHKHPVLPAACVCTQLLVGCKLRLNLRPAEPLPLVARQVLAAQQLGGLDAYVGVVPAPQHVLTHLAPLAHTVLV